MNLHFDNHQFEHRARPVSADTKISWEDYERMSTQTRKQSGERRLPTPQWSLRDDWLRALLVVFIETRLGIFNAKGTLVERREAARAVAIAERPKHAAKLDELNRRFVDAQGQPDITPQRLKSLEREVENLDTFIRTTENGGMDVVAAVAYFYHRCRWDSVRVGEELRLKPPHVRMLLYRLAQVWEKRFTPEGEEKPVAVPRNARTKGIPYERAPRQMTWSVQEAILLRIFGFTFPQIGERLRVKTTEVANYFQNHGIVVPVMIAAPEPEPATESV